MTTYEEHRRNGTWPPLRFIDVLPGDTRGGVIVDLIQDAPDGDVFAGVVFPDGHVEVHRVEASEVTDGGADA